MLILSTFNSDYLQAPLQFLLQKLSKDSLKIEYVESNLSTHLLGLKLYEEKPKFCTVLLRLTDLVENNYGNINVEQLNKNLNSILQELAELKKQKDMSLLLFLCPSVTNSLLEEFKKFEEKIKLAMEINKIHLITYEEIYKKYSGENFINILGEENHIPYTPKFYCEMASLLIRKSNALGPKSYKIIAVDCDNTLWDGIVGEDGYDKIELKEHNLALQKFLISQQSQGKSIVLCSKNDKKIVDKVFDERKDMLLKKEHIIERFNKINWSFKSTNIANISKEANTTSDHIMFIDDNENEIEEVSKNFPAVKCVRMPQDLEEFKKVWEFDIDQYKESTETDKNRTALFREQIAEIFFDNATDEHLTDKAKAKMKEKIEEYHKTLEIIQVMPKNSCESKRISELTHKVNQFNIYREPKEEKYINNFLKDEKNVCFLCRKSNRTQEIGVAGALCEIGNGSYLLLTDFFVSCRAFAERMGIEYFLIKQIGEYAKNKGLKTVKIRFKATDKNMKALIFLNTLIKAGFSESKELIEHSKINEINIDFFSEKLKKLDIIQHTLTGLTNENYFKPAELGKETIKTIQDANNAIIELQEITQSKDYLLKKFFFEDYIQEIKAISLLENRVIALCDLFLCEKESDRSLEVRGLDSLTATILRNCIYNIEAVDIDLDIFSSEKTTVFTLIEAIKEKILLKAHSESETLGQEDSFYDSSHVSSQQRRLWFAEQKEQACDSANYHMIACYKVSKHLDIPRFKLSCKKLIELYDVFGMSFTQDSNTLKQLILAPEDRKLNFTEIALEEISLEEAIELEVSKPWAITSEAPLMHIMLFKDSNYHIFFHVHHGIFDAISLKNLLDTLSKIYHDNNITFSKPPQYGEFIYYQQKKLANKVYQEKIHNFWKNQLSRIETVTTLPIDHSLSGLKPATEQAAERYLFMLSSEDFLALKTLAQSVSITCFRATYALFGILIASYTYQKNITLLTATNGRGDKLSFNKMIGFFVNLLVNQFDLEGNQPLNKYLKYVNEQFLNSQKFQDIPFDEILKILHTQGINDILLSPAFIYQSYAIPELKIENEIAELELPKQTIIFDERKTCRFGHFTLFAQENHKGLNFIIEYAKDLFSTTFIERFAKNFLHVIRQASSNAKQTLQEISVVCDDERNHLIRFGQGPKLEYAKEDNLISRFQHSVEKYPDHRALSYDDSCLSYKEVDQQSKNLAYALTEAGVKQGDHVGIYLAPNHLFFIAELAVLKIGAVFIPLSKEDPDERLKSIIDDAKIKFFIVDNASNGLLGKDFKEYRLISIDQINAISNELPSVVIKMEDMACILYTSGSTGKPKGVILPQKAIFRVIETLSDKVKLGDEIAQTANQAFDAAQLEFFLAVLNAAHLIIFNKNVLLDENLFEKKLSDENIKIIWLTAGLFNLYALKAPEIFKKVRYLMSGGDVVDVKAVEKTLAANPTLQFINGYGPTETGIFALTYTANQEHLKKFSSVPIGAPTIAGTQVFLLNIFNRLAPWGAIGQLGISGDGLGGYYNNKSLQEKCFLSFPENIMFSPKGKPKQMYLSGDKVQIINNKIFYFGRIGEEQIKIRGNLVSLPEIKKALEKHSAIIQAEIIYKKINSKNKALVVFYTKNEESLKPSKGELIEFLSNLLPPTMIPVVYEMINTFQITANGKLDRSALSKLSLTIKEESDPYEGNMPGNLKEIQKKLLSIFENILKGPENILHYTPSLKNNFFHVGGDSIKAVQLIAKIEEDFGKRIAFDTLQKNSTIDALSHFLERDKDHEKDRLSLLHKGTDELLPPIIFMHPAGGGLFCFNKLIDAFQSVKLPNYCYGIEDPVILERQVKTLTIPEMAENYFQYIHEKIKRPFILAGYSFGGMLALEMAAQLERCNQNCLGVILLDTWVVSSAGKNLKDALQAHVLEYCKKVIEGVKNNPKVESVKNLIEPMMEQCQYYQQIGFVFKPQKLVSTPVTLFKAKDTDKFKNMDEETKYNYLEDFIKSKNLIKHEVEGNHFNLLEKNANVDFLGKKIVEYVKDIPKNISGANNGFFQRTGSDMNLRKAISLEQPALIRRN